MAMLGSKIRTQEGGRFCFWCPGCDESHCISVPPWTSFNGDGEKPTIRASVLVQGQQWPTEDEYARMEAGEKIAPRPLRCHSFVTDGRIEFLNDCTHALAGQTVELPPFPMGET